MLQNPDYQKMKEALSRLGVKKGDDLLVHSSFKSLGPVQGGIETLVHALLSTIGESGTLLIPALSFRTVTAEKPVFDIRSTPSCVGAVSEFFRKMKAAVRSMHPTHSVCVLGKRQAEYIKDCALDDEPVGPYSPFCKLSIFGGKVLMLGCGAKPNTSMHGVEEKAKVPYVLSPDTRTYTLTDACGQTYKKAYRYHYIVQNGFRQRYDKLQNLMDFSAGKILEADSILIDSAQMWRIGLEKLREDPYYFVEPL